MSFREQQDLKFVSRKHRFWSAEDFAFPAKKRFSWDNSIQGPGQAAPPCAELA
jgi:hypothetical protein